MTVRQNSPSYSPWWSDRTPPATHHNGQTEPPPPPPPPQATHHVRQNSPSYSPCQTELPSYSPCQTELPQLLTMMVRQSSSRGTLRISGTVKSAILRNLSAVKRRKQNPSWTLPALPWRCLALALLMNTSVSELIWLVSLYLSNTTANTHQHGTDLADGHLRQQTHLTGLQHHSRYTSTWHRSSWWTPLPVNSSDWSHCTCGAEPVACLTHLFHINMAQI